MTYALRTKYVKGNVEAYYFTNICFLSFVTIKEDFGKVTFLMLKKENINKNCKQHLSTFFTFLKYDHKPLVVGLCRLFLDAL
jgi:hypothetical protein